jgi:hypothetical protein
MPVKAGDKHLQQLAESVRAACIAAAREAYESAGISGLCAEGRWENAIGAMQTLDLKQLLATPLSPRATALRSPSSERGRG